MLLTACDSHYTDNAILLKAESLLNEQPDSAYQLLSGIKKPKQLSKSDYAAWCLHYTHAQYKLYMNIKSDSLINVAVNYYANSHLKKYSGISYYVLGCVSDVLKHEKKAMLAYKNAALALNGTTEYNTLGLVTVNMGYIYEQDKNYRQAKNCIKKSVDFFKLSGNKKCLSSSYLALSNMSLQLDYPLDSTLLYSNKALKLAKEVNDTMLYGNIISRQGELLNRKNPRLAINYLLIGYNHCQELKIRNASFLAYIYSGLNMPDSASFYLRIANKEKGNSELELLKNLTGAGVFESRKDFKHAYYLIESAYINQDTVFHNNLQSQSYRIDKQFDLSEKEKENAYLKIANQQKVIIISLLALAVLTVLVILLIIRIRNKQKQAAYELEKQRLEFEIETKKAENELKRKVLRTKLLNKIENTLQLNKLKLGFLDKEKHNEFIAKIAEQSVISPNEWQYYIDEVNHLLDGKITSFMVEYVELTASDLIVIALICLGIDIPNSCILLNMSSNTMYTRRRRIKSKIVLGKDIDLEEWVEQNIS